jgi:hypothetical protein
VGLRQIFNRLEERKKSQGKFHVPTMESGLCKFDVIKVKNYLSHLNQIDTELSNVVRKLLDHTYYATYNDIVRKLNLAFSKFELWVKDEPFIIITRDDDNVTTSESLVIYLLWGRINQLNFKGIYHFKSVLPPDYHKVWLDDAIFSGDTALYVIYTIKSSHLHIVVGYMDSTLTTNVIKQKQGLDCSLYVGQQLTPFSSPLLRKYFLTNNRIPLYLDYKVASAYSTFRYIYECAYIPTNPLNIEGETTTHIANGRIIGGDELEKMYKSFMNLMMKKPSREIVNDLSIMKHCLKSDFKTATQYF